MPEMLKILLPVACVLLVMLLFKLCNLSKEHRGRQLLMVYVSPVLAALEILVAYCFYDGISFEEGHALFGGEVLIWNLAIAAVYLLIKLILCPILSFYWSRYNVMTYADYWYMYDHRSECWCLREKHLNLRQMLKSMMWVVAACCAVVLSAGWYFGSGSPYWLKVFPIGALAVVCEWFYFLSGFTRQEYLHDVDGDDITSTRFAAYYKLRKIYEKMFPAAMLVSHTGNEYTGKEGATQLLENMINSADPTEQIVGRFFKSRNSEHGQFDVDLIKSTNLLMHKQSTLIFNPFYRDLSDYVLLPMVNSLLNNRKCLIIVGRASMREDVAEWATELLKSYSRTRTLWRVADLTKEEPECEIGILSFSQIYDTDVLNANVGLFKEVGFVMVIEPSRMLTTSQSGLSIIVDQTDKSDPPTYCICDHDTDGLVDTVSHIFQTEITNVVAAPIPRSVYTVMGWSATGDYIRQKLFEKQTHFLGNGIELASVALKNQIPHVTWYSAEKAPVQDIRWIAGQYYPQICRYAHLPNQQSSLDERITYSSNLWGSAVKKEEFVIVEDEFCNMFAMLRAYLSRGDMQAFVNVLSENYLLRDYMRYNHRLFMNDPKAVPSIAPSYIKTERNTVMRLILMMAYKPVSEDYVAQELNLMGYESANTYQKLCELISRYTFVNENIVMIQNRQEMDHDLAVPFQIPYYSIARQSFNVHFADTLKNAFFVVEDEKLETEHIDARLFEHITQTVMPGQYVTYNGKYYKVHRVSSQVGCILHRAADNYTGRSYYRQLRTYHFGPVQEQVSVRKIMDIEISMERRAFSVDTSGYLDMKDNHDLRTARVVDLTDDPCIASYNRQYKNKRMLRLVLPDTDERIRFTISMLLSEILRSVFPDAWPYLAVLCAEPEDVGGMLDKVNYRVDGEIDPNVIYIVEDSNMDLGLLEAVDSHLMRLFEIMADYLNWHFTKMRESPRKDPVLPPIEPIKEEEAKRRSFLARLLRMIARLFSAWDEKEHDKEKPESKDVPEKEEREGSQPEPVQESPTFENGEEDQESAKPTLETQEENAGTLDSDFELAENARAEESSEKAQPADAQNDGQAEEEPAPEPIETKIPDDEKIVVHTIGEGMFLTDNIPDDLDLIIPAQKSRYQSECYLKFGFDEIDARLSIEEVENYLTVRGWSNNDLTKARKRTELEETFADTNVENHCDFCFLPLTGVSYERLSDGRVRCNDCTMTAINTVEAFTALFNRTEMMMENVFSIHIPVNIAVKTADARTIAKHTGSVFTPTTKVASRTLGFAQRKNGRYSLFVENGSPRLATIDTVVHEMTHIWQYLNWNDSAVRRIYHQNKLAWSRMARDIVYEGMAVWAAVQMLYAMGEISYARQQEHQAEHRDDVYGMGFRIYRDRFGLERNGEAPVYTPFTSFPPVDPIEVTRIIEEAMK